MALTFPSSPTNGQVYTDTATGNRYVYDSTKGLWKVAANTVAMSVSSTPPANVATGSLWFNREIGRTFIYYNDDDSSQWIETVPSGSIDTSTIAAYVNPIYASLNSCWTSTNTSYTFANLAITTANTAFPNTPNVSYNGSFYVPNGAISIGTNSYPTGKFQVVVANGEISRFTATGASGGYQVSFFDNSTPWYFGSAKATIAGNINDLYLGSGYGTTNNLIFGLGATEKMRIDANSVNVATMTGSIRMPVGTTAQRPAGLAGMIRYNSTTNYPEWYDTISSSWTNFKDTPTYAITYLAVGGGGGGGGGTYHGAGGGAGGFVTTTASVSRGVSYAVTVGAGGAGGAGSARGATGSDSAIATIITAYGGGGGGNYNVGAGLPGGSGGGGPYNYTYGAGTAGQGNRGGSGATGGVYGSGGGGGASAVGNDGTTSVGGNGGAGSSSSITGSSVTYAGGGGGSSYSSGSGGSGGAGGGGTGSTAGSTVPGAGTTNLGGGGGGTERNTYTTGAAGGSGIVVISYASATQLATGGTVTSYLSGPTTYWVHTFTTSGTFTA